ncbi:MAG: hypothetical protein AB7O44_19945 [Hyphomicrobiaceae bacterium]
MAVESKPAADQASVLTNGAAAEHPGAAEPAGKSNGTRQPEVVRVAQAGEVQGTELALRCHELVKIAEAASEKVMPHLAEVAAISSKEKRLYIIKDRHKGADKILDKVLRKRRDISQNANGAIKTYNPNDVTDVWGVRCVTLFPQNIGEVAKGILDFIKGSANTELRVCLRDAEIYTNRPDADPLSIVADVQRILDESGLLPGGQRRDANRESGYSSLHLILSVPIKLRLANKGLVNETCYFEVQIRDMFEETWGEIAHTLYYNEKDLMVTGHAAADGASNELWKPQLNALKAMLDACSQHAGLIEQSKRKVRQLIRNRDRYDSVTDLKGELEAILAVILNDTNTEELRGTVEQAFALLEEGNETTDRELDPQSAKVFYRAAAERFERGKAILGEYASRRLRNAAQMPTLYYLNMEHANALTFSLPSTTAELSDDDLRSWQKAHKIYLEVKQTHPDNAAVYLRLGQFLSRSRPSRHFSKESARKALLEAKENLEQVLDKAPHDRVVEGDDNSIYYDAPVALAGALDALADISESTDEKCSYYRQAIVQITSIIDPERIRHETNRDKLRIFHRSVSNTIYFIYELSQLDPSIKDTERARLRECLTLLTTPPLNAYAERYVESIDNIVIAADLVGDVLAAREKAHLNMQHLERIGFERLGRDAHQVAIQSLSKPQREMYDRAAEIVRRLASNKPKARRS